MMNDNDIKIALTQMHEFYLAGLSLRFSQNVEFLFKGVASSLYNHPSLSQSDRRSLRELNKDTFPKDLFASRSTLGSIISIVGEISHLRVDDLNKLLEMRNIIAHTYFARSNLDPSIYNVEYLNTFIELSRKWIPILLGFINKAIIESDKNKGSMTSDFTDEDWFSIDQYEAISREFAMANTLASQISPFGYDP